eukprot:TRINITY_DN21054_c0_g1_i1.p1 TRINITY_DN21054_c0_g1~~TRINITY_DN21054_c0_g1_i1.p1  ORF type:complete len:556 (+),score=230.02 TRINITY_DN21054_c0_g1_i1:50-1669(+)
MAETVTRKRPLVQRLSSRILGDEGDEARQDNQMKYIKLLYGAGHILNDLCAASWFTYMLVFFEYVAGRSATAAGGLVLVGQVVDGLATPVVGVLCDKSAQNADPTIPGDTVAKRLPWHLGGSLMVLFSYPFLFLQDAQYTFGHTEVAVFMWYAIYVSIFQTGWATTQISHLSLIPDLSTGCPERRTALNATRYAATVLSTVAVYVVAYILLGTAGTDTDSPSSNVTEVLYDDNLMGTPAPDSDSSLTVDNKVQFRELATFITCTGFFFTFIIFQLGMRLSARTAGHLLINPDSPTTGQQASTGETVKMWLKCKRFYCVAVMYMCTRLVVNMSQSFLPYYLTKTLGMNKTSIALGPLTLYICSFGASMVIGNLAKRIGAYKSYLLSLTGISGACCLWYFIDGTPDLVYIPCGIFGFFSSLLMVSCLSIVAELIKDLPGSAFVYGAFSFTDKLSSGIVIMLIQYGSANSSDDDKPHYYRLVVSIFPLFVAALGILSVLVSFRLTSPATWDEYLALQSEKARLNTPQKNVQDATVVIHCNDQ